MLWPPHVKSWLIGKDPDAGRDWGQEEKGTTEDEMAGWHHRLDGHEFEQTQGVGDGQGGLACCDSWGRRVGHDWATELTELMLWYGHPWWLRWQTAGQQRGRPRFNLWVGKIAWRREWLPSPVFLPGEFHGQSLIGYSFMGSQTVRHDFLTDTFTFTHILWQQMTKCQLPTCLLLILMSISV